MSRPAPGGRDWLHPHRLEYVPLDDELAVLRVSAGLARGLQPPAGAALVAGAPHTVVRATVLGSVTHRASRRPRPADQLLWRATFALPLELLECPQTLFALVAADHAPRRLPAPAMSSLEALCRHWELGPHGASLLSGLSWRRAAALGTAVAVAGTSALPPAVAFGSSGRSTAGRGLRHRNSPRAHIAAPVLPWAHIAGSTSSGQSHSDVSSTEASRRTTSTSQRQLHVPSGRQVQVHPAGQRRARSNPSTTGTHHHRDRHSARSGSAATAPTPNPTTSSSTASQAPSAVPATAPARPHRHRHVALQIHTPGGGGGFSTQTQAQPSGGGLSSITPTAPAYLISSAEVSNPRAAERQHRHSSERAGQHQIGGEHRHQHHRRGARRDGPRPRPSGGSGLSSVTPSRVFHRSRPTHTAPAEQAGTPSSSTGQAPQSIFWTTGMGSSSAEAALLSRLFGLPTNSLQPPAFLVPIYQAAGLRFNIPWEVLAAINSIETDYGRNMSVSSAGAVGWMQFMPSTWAQYGMSLGGHGVPNPYNPADAIFSAARYLAANGASHNLRRAIFAYNHAQWYVDSVMWRASLITGRADLRGLGSYSLPLDARYMHAFRRTHDGVYLDGVPVGAAVHSMTTGVVTALAKDPAGVGADYPIVEVTKGPLTGRYIYYRQIGASLVRVGQRVHPGQPIAVVDQTPDARLNHGRIEIGFSDASGHPINQQAPIGAWTPSVATMRRVLSALVARKMLHMAQGAAGGPYSVANHASAFDQPVSWLKQAGTDCSGFVSWLLGPQGIADWPTSFATPSIPTAPNIRAGFGEYVTLWNNPAAASAGHVFIEILGHWFESAGGIGIHQMPTAEAMNYIASGLYSPHHPAGL
jgi:hypothetical protein